MEAQRILIVEDSAALRKLLAMRLQKLGAKVITAEDGQKGFDLIQQEEIDLVLSDVDMPIMNGLQLCKAIKSQSKTRGTPVILLSAMDSEADIERGFEAGASAYILKSSSDDQLTKTINEVLNKTAFKKDRLVLVVDDSHTILRLVEVGLAKNGFQVVTALNGREALDKLKSHKPNIIISDLDMPVMDGMELCDEIHRNPNLATIPFMVMSANSERSTMRTMIERGASAYMVKPFNMEQLIITVEKLLSEQFQMILKDRERLELDRKSMLASITSLVQALEARDSYTRGHSERVSEIVTGMAKVFKMDQEDIESLRLGARLHDIGKIGIPDGLLLKPGKLLDEEIAIFQKHPVIGMDILKPISSLNYMLPIVLHHHEHYNGGGYPGKLVGEEIPFMARITAVGDCFDALTTDRPYRKGFSRDKAFSIINEIRGTQLCPSCVEAFFEWINNDPDFV